MDHLMPDARGYWHQGLDAHLAARLAVRAERDRWQKALAAYLPADTIRIVTESVKDAAEQAVLRSA